MKGTSSNNQRKSRTDDFSFEQLLKEAEEMRKRQEIRDKVEALLSEDVDDSPAVDRDDSMILSAATENLIGKEFSDRVKEALARIGGDLTREGGFYFFNEPKTERKFDRKWIKDVRWLKGFEGRILNDFLVLTVDEETRNDLVESGLVRDMVALNERLPSEIVIWFLEHGNLNHCLG